MLVDGDPLSHLSKAIHSSTNVRITAHPPTEDAGGFAEEYGRTMDQLQYGVRITNDLRNEALSNCLKRWFVKCTTSERTTALGKMLFEPRP